MDFFSSVSSLFKRPKRDAVEENFDFLEEVELGSDEEILAEEEPEIETDNSTKSFGPFSDSAARFLARINHALPATIAAHLKKAQDPQGDSPSLTNKLEPELKMWFTKLKCPSCTHLEVRLKEFVEEFLKQELPLSVPKPTQHDKAEDKEQPSVESVTEQTEQIVESMPPQESASAEEPTLAPEVDSTASKEKEEERAQKLEMDQVEASLQAFQREQGAKVQNAIESFIKLFKTHPFWSDLSPVQEDILWECIERYIIIKISRKAQVSGKMADFKFYELAATFSFIVPYNLDIKYPISDELIQVCGSILDSLNFFKTPRSKLITISNCCVIIFNYLSKVSGRLVSADEFLPVLTYIIIKTNPVSLISNTNFITDYRHDKFLLSSWGYLFTNMSICIDYIQHLTPKFLSAEEPSRLESDWIGLTNSPNPQPTQSEQPKKKDDDIDVSVAYPFWNFCVSDLTEDHLPTLLSEYKRLALFEHNMKKKGFSLFSPDGSAIS